MFVISIGGFFRSLHATTIRICIPLIRFNKNLIKEHIWLFWDLECGFWTFPAGSGDVRIKITYGRLRRTIGSLQKIFIYRVGARERERGDETKLCPPSLSLFRSLFLAWWLSCLRLFFPIRFRTRFRFLSHSLAWLLLLCCLPCCLACWPA